MVLDVQVATVSLDDTRYPLSPHRVGDSAPPKIWAAGPLGILEADKTGFFCSSQCPGGVILKTFDAIAAMRDDGRTLVGGFHSPMEWECLGILLRGRQPAIWVPARSIFGMRLKPELQAPFAAGRLLILSPFEPKHKRITAALAEARNRFVGALADRVFVAHAAPASRTLALCEELRRSGKEIVTVDDPMNQALLALGATRQKDKPVNPRERFLDLFRKALLSITEPRYYETERGFQGCLLTRLQELLPEAALPGNPIIEQEYQKTIPAHRLKIRPDLIVHVPFERGLTERTEGNFVAIEIKLRATASEAQADFESLQKIAQTLHYGTAVFLNIASDKTYADLCPPAIADKTACFAVQLKDGQPVVY
jgi:hypothetical protein